MKELSVKGERFVTRWKKQRTKKWQYAFIHGSIYWGLPVVITLFLIDSQFQVENIQLTKLLTWVPLYVIGGFFFGLYQFRKIDGIYLSVCDDDDIHNGIIVIESGNTWNYENLQINKINDKTLVVKNKLFWFEDSDVSTDKLNECFNMVMSDFQRLKKNLLFKDYSDNYEVRLQVFDNSDKDIPLTDRIITKFTNRH